jgi:hypothetical protein
MSFNDCCNERDMYTSTHFAIAKCEQLSYRTIALSLRNTVHFSWRKLVPNRVGEECFENNCAAKAVTIPMEEKLKYKFMRSR